MKGYDMEAPEKDINVGDTERMASVFGGGLLAIKGLKMGGILGNGLAALGGVLAYRGLTGHCDLYKALDISTAGKEAKPEEEVH